MKSTSKFPVIVVAVLALALATVGIASAITNGVPDGNNHPYGAYWCLTLPQVLLDALPLVALAGAAVAP